MKEQDIFESLFLSKEEEREHQLAKLAKRFILCEKDMMELLKDEVYDKKYKYKLTLIQYLSYRNFIENRPPKKED